jgi:hypothetical protein
VTAPPPALPDDLRIPPDDLRFPVHTGWIAACIILFWPLAIAAVLAANRAARAHGAGDAASAHGEAHRARARARLGVLIGGILAAIVLAYYATLGAIGVWALPDILEQEGIDTVAAEPAPSSYRTAAAPKREPITLDPLQLRDGDCFVAPDWEAVWEAAWVPVDVIPCSRLHDAQVIGVTEHRHEEFPGAGAISDAAWYDCAPKYEEYSGRTLAEDSPVWTIEPTWDDWGDGLQSSVCFVQLQEPVRGELSDYPHLFETEETL